MTNQEFENLNKYYQNLFMQGKDINLTKLLGFLEDALKNVEAELQKNRDNLTGKQQQQRLKLEIQDEIAKLNNLYQLEFKNIVNQNANLGTNYVIDFLKLNDQSGFVNRLNGVVDSVTLKASERTYSDNLTLPNRIKNYSDYERYIINKELVSGIRSGLSQNEIVKNIRSSTDLGKSRVERLVNTETRLAFQGAESESADIWNKETDDDFKIYYEWRLSPRHKTKDICDDFAGKVYDPKYLPKSHPFCLCFTVPVMKSIQTIDKIYKESDILLK